MASTFLFVGPPGIGKRTFALQLAQGLLCDTVPPERFEPCGHCPACIQVAAGTHPDVEVVARPPDKSFIPLALLIGEDERRMREGLCYNISLKPFSGKRRIAIIDDADFLNQEGANCLLKTLEEPPPGAVLILLSASEQRQLPTIRSRSQVIRFRPLATSEVESILLSNGLIESPDEAARAAARSEGSVERALLASDAAMSEYQAELLRSALAKGVRRARAGEGDRYFRRCRGQGVGRQARTTQAGGRHGQRVLSPADAGPGRPAAAGRRRGRPSRIGDSAVVARRRRSGHILPRCVP